MVGERGGEGWRGGVEEGRVGEKGMEELLYLKKKKKII
jgi:hypothetical protein